MRLIVAIRASAFVAVTLVAAQAHAQSSCPAVDAFWFNAIASGNTVSYGFGVDGTIQPLKGLKDGTALSAVGVIKFFGTSMNPGPQGGSTIAGTVSGYELQNSGGQVTNNAFGLDDTSVFHILTHDCTGMVTRVFADGSTVIWHIVVVDGENAIRYMDRRANPSVRTGVLQLMR
jgi:hypothetical protein